MTENTKNIAGLDLNHQHCLDALYGLRLLSDKSVDCVVTSPPYNLIREYTGGGPLSCHTNGIQKKLEEEWYEDSMPEEEYRAWQREVIAECLRVCRGSVFYNHKVRYAWKRRGRILHPMEWLSDFPIWCEIIWDRGGGICYNSRRYIPTDERIFMIGRPAVWKSPPWTTVWKIAPVSQDVGHPCPFPPELPRRCIEPTTNEGDIVLDPFAGSGTTGVVAMSMGRAFIGFDKDAGFCRIANERLATVLDGIPSGERRQGQMSLLELCNSRGQSND